MEKKEEEEVKIVTVRKDISEIVETDEGDWPTYRRHSEDNWENLMGESWEPVYLCKEIEAAYQLYKKEKR